MFESNAQTKSFHGIVKNSIARIIFSFSFLFLFLSYLFHSSLHRSTKEKSLIKKVTHRARTEKRRASVLLLERDTRAGKLEKYAHVYTVLKYDSVRLRMLHVGVSNVVNDTIYVYSFVIRFAGIFRA